PRGVVRITAPGDAALMGIPEALVAFGKKFPSIHIEMLLTSRVVDLVAEGIDLAIRAGRLADSTLVARKIGTTNAGLFASAAYLDQRGRPKKVSELTEHDCVLFRGRGGHSTWLLEGPKGPESVDVTGPVSADDFGFVMRTVEAGLGIAQLPLFVGNKCG